MNKLLRSLGIDALNSGACSAPGKWAPTADRTAIVSINPATGEPLARVAAATPADYGRVIGSATAAYEQWRTVPAPRRGEIIRQIGDALRAGKDALGSLVSLEMGKIKQEGLGEVQEMIDMADFAVGQSRMLYGNTMHSERPLHRMYEQWHPLGVVGVVTAFNFPVAVWAWNAFIAAICGNVVVWKPSSKVPLCAIAVQHICNAVLKANGLPAIFTVFVGNDAKLKEKFLDDPRVALVSFTGSSRVGHDVARTVAKRLGRTLLELGGNNAVIVDESADLDLAVPAILFGAVGTAGQRCTTTRRVIAHKTVHDELLERLRAAYAQVRIGDPLDPATLMGPLIDVDAVARYTETLNDLKQRRARIVCGGRVVDRPGFFVEPTIVRARNEWDVVRRETFAPILYTMSFRKIDEAIALNNAVPQGLSSSIFTRDLQHAERFLSAQGSDCGIANVNIGTSGAEIGGAFGGEKETGGGREAGSDAWKAYMRRQTNTINWSRELPLAQGIKFALARAKSKRR
jgi:aldehyde dehydrogenase (NAD+)